ncbi:MAG: tRNA pseudouridine(38-40) synthase TruA [Bacteroidota bacterium]
MRYFIEIAYNGKNYHGWQIQPDAISVQQVLEEAMSTVLREPIKVVGAGRTDTGVHARQLFAHFDFGTIEDTEAMTFKFNSLLPRDISVKRMLSVHDDAHARFDAIEREYQYHITLQKDPFGIDFMHLLHRKLDIEAMNEAAQLLLGYKDFQCFSRNKTGVKTYYCDVKYAAWELQGNQLIFTVRADRFLRNMVRAMVGTLLEIGSGKIQASDLERILESKDRSEAKTSAPAKGLYLTRVLYPYDLT